MGKPKHKSPSWQEFVKKSPMVSLRSYVVSSVASKPSLGSSWIRLDPLLDKETKYTPEIKYSPPYYISPIEIGLL